MGSYDLVSQSDLSLDLDVFMNACCTVRSQQGALSEYVAVPATDVARKPDGSSLTDCAGIPLAGITAYDALCNVARIEPGQTVFIN